MLYLVCMNFQDIPNVSFEFVSVKMYTLLESMCLVVLDLFIKENLSTHLLVPTQSAETCTLSSFYTQVNWAVADIISPCCRRNTGYKLNWNLATWFKSRFSTHHRLFSTWHKTGSGRRRTVLNRHFSMHVSTLAFSSVSVPPNLPVIINHSFFPPFDRNFVGGLAKRYFWLYTIPCRSKQCRSCSRSEPLRGQHDYCHDNKTKRRWILPCLLTLFFFFSPYLNLHAQSNSNHLLSECPCHSLSMPVLPFYWNDLVCCI